MISNARHFRVGVAISSAAGSPTRDSNRDPSRRERERPARSGELNQGPALSRRWYSSRDQTPLSPGADYSLKRLDRQHRLKGTPSDGGGPRGPACEITSRTPVVSYSRMLLSDPTQSC